MPARLKQKTVGKVSGMLLRVGGSNSHFDAAERVVVRELRAFAFG